MKQSELICGRNEGGNLTISTVVHGPSRPIHIEASIEDLQDMQSAGWHVTLSDRDYSASVLTPYANGGRA